MNREIKFRAWDGTGMRLSPCISECHHLASWFEAHSIYGLTNTQSTFMQFTGLIDKNGNEIYEGDIVRREINVGFAEHEVKNWVVYWSRWCWSRGNMDMTIGFGFDPIDARSNCEVIGNIYENPELLNLQHGEDQ